MRSAVDDPALVFDGVWRRYPGADARPRGLRAALSRDPLRRAGPVPERWALRAVDLRVSPGDAVAVVGRNGAGKSTLLRLAGGIGRPERGTVHVAGRVGALIDLGHEFHGELTGRQNAEVAAVVAGLSRRAFRQRLGAILEFAELEGAVDQPLRAYSDGMRARLAFSVMVHLDPQLLLVDEVLAVGDASFQRRSVERIDALRAAGVAVLFVSHDLGLVRRVCDRAVWLDRGEVRAEGPSAGVVRDYVSDVAGERGSGGAARQERSGAIADVAVRDQWGAPLSAIASGDGMEVAVAVALPEAHGSGHLRVRVMHPGRSAAVVDTSTGVRRSPGSRAVVRFSRLDLAPGEYRVEVGVYSEDWTVQLGEVDAATVVVRGEGPDTALLAPPHEWRQGA